MLSGEATKTNIARVYLKPLKPIFKYERPARIQKLLRSIDEFEVESAVSTDTDITDAMEEYHKESIYSNKAAIRHLDRNQINSKIVDSFTEVFNKSLLDVRREMNLIDADIFLNPKEEIFAILNRGKPKPKSTEESLRKKLATLLDAENIIEKPEPANSEVTSEMTYDYMSGVWKMMEENSKEKEFFVTPPAFNIHNQEKKHWLNYPPIPDDVVEDSREKCRKWLKQQAFDDVEYSKNKVKFIKRPK